MFAVQDVHLRVGDEDGAKYVAEARADISAFRVITRCRPFIREEKERMAREDPTGKSDIHMRSVIEMQDVDGTPTVFVCDPANNWQRTHSFTYDRTLWSIDQKLKHTNKESVHKPEDAITQEKTYQICTTDPESGYTVVDQAFLGVNSNIMTYGQTSSGKTHTMLGNYKDDDDEKERGVIPRVCDEVFRKVEDRNQYEARKPDKSKRWTLKTSVSFVEIYNDKVADLLDESAPAGGQHRAGDMRGRASKMKEVVIRGEGTAGGPFLEGLEPKPVSDWNDCRRLLRIGSRNRTTAQTTVHDQSSRSHAIFCLTLSQTRATQERVSRHEQPKQQVRIGRINLVDLAGSERGGGEAYQSESSAINSSLLVLRRVIEALADRQDQKFKQLAAAQAGMPAPSVKTIVVPQRESVLTRMLDLEGTNAKGVMIANLTPYHKFYEETLRTLEWSHKARKLVTVVHSNAADSADILEGRMNANVARMQNALADQKMTVGSLQKELDTRKQRIKSLEAENDVIRQRIAGLDKEYHVARKNRSEKFIQLVFYRHYVKKLRRRRTAEFEKAEQEKEDAEKELEGVKENFAAIKESLVTQDDEMDKIRAKAEHYLKESHADPSKDMASLDEQKEKVAAMQAELADVTKGLKAAEESKREAENIWAQFEKESKEYNAARKEDQKKQEAALAEIEDALLDDLNGALAPNAALYGLGVGPVPTDWKTGDYPECTYGDGVGATEAADPAPGYLKVFDYSPEGNGTLGQWTVSEELKAATQQAKKALTDADAKLKNLQAEKQRLQKSAADLEADEKKRTAEAKELGAQILALKNDVSALEKKKACC